MGRVLQTGGWVGEEAGPDVYVHRKEQVFPTLGGEMIDRMRPYGRVRSFESGAFLYRSCERGVDLHVVPEGAVEILDDGLDQEASIVVTYGHRQFTGEFDQLSGRATLVSARAAQPVRALAFDRSGFRSMVQAQPDIADCKAAWISTAMASSSPGNRAATGPGATGRAVRSGSVTRVAAAVGEGAVVLAEIHHWLRA